MHNGTKRASKSPFSVFATFIAVAGLALLGVQPANASSEPSTQGEWYEYYGVTEEEAKEFEEIAEDAEITPELIDEARNDLVEGGYSYTVETTDHGDDVWVFDLPEERQVGLPADGAAIDPNALEPMLGGGITSNGMYITFNSVDQAAISTGAAAGLSIALCALPGIGLPLCIINGVVIAAATVYINAYGVCSGSNGTLRVDAGYDGTVNSTRCV